MCMLIRYKLYATLKIQDMQPHFHKKITTQITPQSQTPSETNHLLFLISVLILPYFLLVSTNQELFMLKAKSTVKAIFASCISHYIVLWSVSFCTSISLIHLKTNNRSPKQYKQTLTLYTYK